MTKLAPEWVRTSDPVIRSPARYRWTTAPANRQKGEIGTNGKSSGKGNEYKTNRKRKQIIYSDSEDTDESETAVQYMDSDDDVFQIDTGVCAKCGKPENYDLPDWVGCDLCPRYLHISFTGNEDLQNLSSPEELEDIFVLRVLLICIIYIM